MAHTLVIGSGIVGASIARECAARDDRVTVVSAHPPGGLASGASFGWINASFYLSAEHFALRHAAMGYHRQVSTDFPEVYAWTGCLWFEAEGAESARMEADLGALGYRVERPSRAAIAARLPALGPIPEGALFFPDEGAADPAALARAMLGRSGITLVQASVTALVEAGGRITGALTAEGPITADRVVVAAGIGAPGLLAPLGLDLPMLKRPGMIVATEPLPPICPVILATPGQEIRQDAAGRLIAPASANHQGDTAEKLGPFPVMVNETLQRMRGLFPGQDIRFGAQAMAMRPVPRDGLPVVGASRIAGLWIAVMHSGATLGPLVGALLAEEMRNGPESPLLAPFRPGRFGL